MAFWLLSFDELFVDSDSEKWELFELPLKRTLNNYTTQPAQVDLTAWISSRDVFSYELFEIYERDIARSVGKLKYSYGPGLDGIPQALLK